MGRISLTSGSLLESTYQYWPDGNLKRRIDGAAGRTEYFTYDGADRLRNWTVSVNFNSAQTSYEYDDLGNLTAAIVEGNIVDANSYGFNAGPHALTGNRDGTYVYDARGRQVQHVAVRGPGRTVEYTAFDLPRKITAGTYQERFAYDAFGKRVSKASDSAETIYVADLYERRTDAAGVRHVFRVRGPDGEIAQLIRGADEKDDAVRYIHADDLGTVAVVTDGAGVELERRWVEPFGRRVDLDGAPVGFSASDVKIGFTGHRLDEELGLIDMRGRIYDPILRRFLTPDPHITNVFDGQGYNRYSYVTNNPLRFVDPSGYDKMEGQCAYQGPNAVNCTDGDGVGGNGVARRGSTVRASAATARAPAPAAARAGRKHRAARRPSKRKGWPRKTQSGKSPRFRAAGPPFRCRTDSAARGRPTNTESARSEPPAAERGPGRAIASACSSGSIARSGSNRRSRTNTR